ncbi:hypothetical protein [Mesorhizobium sp. NPDC059025]|uniref:hypothetical protein n=1 Tax=unclassified Mesorhizobium TaxID=325217 RepID=UPI0036944DB3
MTDVDFLGAVASNAGDEFHVLWAAREMLRLLSPDGDVIAVKVEGLPSDEAHNQLGEHAQAADVTLTRQTAEGQVFRYLQLKYSASNPQENWTWSRLLARRLPTKPQSSVLGKLAGLMKAVAFKGDFAIITNQHLSKSVALDIERLTAIRRKQTPKDAELTKTLSKRLGLGQKQLLAFLRSWDLSGFSAASRLSMESEVLQHLVNMYDADARDDANLLQKRVATLMLPESRREPPVTREVLATWLGVGNERMLYPATSRMKAATPYLRREVMKTLGAKLVAPQLRPLRVHAGGGCGKTSLLCDLGSVLPEGSEVFLYDCYGGGLFLASDQKRHLPEQAFVQIGNELAARLRTPLVVRRQGSIDVFDAFRNRAAIAAALLAERSPDAVLVLCFDAVDNARKGSLHWHEPCFVDVMSEASGWPDNVRIILSCRSARLSEVGSQHLFEDFEISPLDEGEVKRLVALWQPNWPADLASTFKDLTGGNPRRLVYAIEGLPDNGAGRAIERLMPKAEGIDPLFKQRVSEAGKHFGDPNKIWQILDALAHLPRPVPAQLLAALAGITPADIRDIAGDIGGIVERQEGWSFHDEDFEAFVVDRPDNGGKALLARAADLLLQTRLDDRYAATSVAEVLASAGRLDALYMLVTQEEQPSSVLSSLEAQFVWSRRLGLAIRCCREASDIGNACNLLISSADALSRTELLEALTVDNLDLSVRFAAEEANRLVMVGQKHTSKRARLRIELARQAASTQPGLAKSHLRWWDAHLRELRKTGRPGNFSIKAQDIAAEYTVYAALYGEEEAFSRLFDWHPKSALLPVFHLLAAHAAGRNRQALRQAILARPWPVRTLAALMAAALLAGTDITAPEMRDGLERLARATPARWPKAVYSGSSRASVLAWDEALLLIAECAVGHVDLHPSLGQLLGRAFPKPELEQPHDLYRLRSAGARHARVHALREKLLGVIEKVSEWLPPQRRVPPPPSTQRRSQRDERRPEQLWNDALQEAIPVYTRLVDAARATLEGLAGDPVTAWLKVTKVLDLSRAYSDSSKRDPDTALLLMRNHLLHMSLRGGDIAQLIPQMREVLQSWAADNIERWHDIAETLTLVPHAHDTVLEILTGLATEIEAQPLPASNRVKLLAKCARIALPLDETMAQWLFGKAVNATTAVDFEAHSALAAAGAMARSGLEGAHAQTARFAARLANAAGAVVESLGIGDDFDWGMAASWVAAANLPTGLAAAIRWHERGLVSLHHSLPPVLRSNSTFTFAQRAALATLSTEEGISIDLAFGEQSPLPDWSVELALDALRQNGDIEFFLAGLKALKDRAGVGARQVIDEAQRRGDVLAAWREAEATSVDVDAVGPRKVDTTQRRGGGAPIGDPAGIRAALNFYKNDRVLGAQQFIEVAQRIQSRALRVPFLEAALELAGTDGALGKAVPKILGTWSDYPPVAEWAGRRLPEYIAGALNRLLDGGYQDTTTLDAVLNATGLGPGEQANVLLDGIEREGERISAHLLFVLTGLIAARAPEDRRAKLFDLLLLRVETRTSHPPKVNLGGPLAPEDVGENVARSLFAAMGDMDRRIRWRASHAALVLLRGGDTAWDRLVECLSDEDTDLYKGEPFYRHGALEQLMMVVQRAALERPAAVARHTLLILQTIRRDPHLIVRELGRSTLLSLDDTRTISLQPADRDFLEKLNRSQLPPVEQNEKSFRHQRSREDERRRKYRFDETDAIPYWYQPIVKQFDITMDAFLDRLEHWLHDKWGYVETTTHWVHEPRRERLEHVDTSTDRRHGTLPTIERLSYHIEWHAMMCAVGELIVEQPLVKQTGGKDHLKEWIYESMPTLEPYWLSDLRTAAPAEPRFWGVAQAAQQHFVGNLEERSAQASLWGRAIPSEIFDTEVSTDGRQVVAAHFELRWSNVTQHVDICSAFATPQTALSLARALATADNHMDFALPDARYHQDIDAPGFKLAAWLKTSERDPLADKFDTRRGSVSGIPVRPTGVTRSERLVFDLASSTWQSPEGTAAIAIDQWGSGENHNGHGWRATADSAFLKDLLARTNHSLIILVEISRQVRDEEISRNPKRWELYTLDAAGKLVRAERHRRDLGRYFVRREGLANSVDTLGRWMLHRIAELAEMRKKTDPAERSALDSDIDDLCQAYRKRRRDWQ